jgi:hypothetical protein
MSSKLFLTVVLRGQPKGEAVVDLNDKGSLSEKAYKERVVDSLHLHMVQAGGLIIYCCLLTRKMLAEAPRTQRESLNRAKPPLRENNKTFLRKML